MDHAPYLLSPHTHICRTAFHWVLLDLDRDKYFTIHKQYFDGLGPYIRGWIDCIESNAVEPATLRDPPADLVNELLQSGNLTTDSVTGRPIRPALQLPKRSVSTALEPLRATSAARYGVAFLRASMKADRLLTRAHISQTVRYVYERKQKHATQRKHFDFSEARRLYSAFAALRPFYPRDYLCLFDSLAFLEFLCGYGLFPAWVFGVTSDPFKAHCWVQQGEVVLNDSVERAGAYVPIMTV